MRPLSWACLAFFVTGCVIPLRVPIRVGVGTQTRSVLYVHEEQEQRARTTLERTKQQAAMAARTLSAVKCESSRCYAAGEVASLVDALRERLRSDFPEEAEALRIAIENAIATELARLRPKPRSAVQPVKLQAVPADAIYDADEVERVFARIAAAIDAILKLDKLALTLSVQSTPPEADFVIQIKDNVRSQRTITTNDQLPNVWRGVYTATVRKQGFRDAIYTLDLINDSRTQVLCTLRPEGNGQASSCRVR